MATSVSALGESAEMVSAIATAELPSKATASAEVMERWRKRDTTFVMFFSLDHGDAASVSATTAILVGFHKIAAHYDHSTRSKNG
jgi:hypothetical protein